ncbi:sigma-54 interaction domain-containing protein [Acidovorax sp. LjRoot194]|uniref:sigma-54 interaction domain-containing protein n=1 Tax=Acidovorax sp. LjRoot194 TaxID=3342280 RepID=UPI003ECFBCA7
MSSRLPASSGLLSTHRVLTLPESPAGGAPTIRAKALLFHDPRSAQLLDHVDRIARSDASVLVVGETGTGKELIARHIHAESGRRGPFVAVNCGAFSESLIDAELFGHEAGAFTGATQARAGWFEASQGGTLFLDEIGDLPQSLQVKLLRVLQERQVVRLGSRKPIALDVRLVAATNIDLARAVRAQHFRADLYYRLNVAAVDLPPLRERPGDILPLAEHFMDLYAQRLGQPPARLSTAARHALLSYAWPGNIRELENVVHFALIVARLGVIEPCDLKLVPALLPQPPVASTVAVAAGTPQPPSASSSLQAVLHGLLAQGAPGLYQTVEAALVRSAFEQAHENQVQAARLLGVTRNTLRTLLKRHGLLADPAHHPTHSLPPHAESPWRYAQ